MCFTPGSLIATPGGPRPVETIERGDLVATVEGRAEPVVWCGRSRVTWAEQMANPRKRPVRIGKDALAPGVPERAVMLSPQHRVMCRTPLARRIGGQSEGLVPALALTALPHVRLMPSLPGLDFVHIACARHTLLLAEGLVVESLLPGPLMSQAMSASAADDLAQTLGWADGNWGVAPPARPILSMRKAEKLVDRSLRYRQALWTAPSQEPARDTRLEG